MTHFSKIFANGWTTGRDRLVVFLCCVLTLPAFAQQPLKTLLVGVDHRSVTSLDGDWHYLVDPPPAKALYAADGKVRDNGYALNTHPNIDGGPHNEEYDFATAPMLKVPGDWNTLRRGCLVSARLRISAEAQNPHLSAYWRSKL
jgi:beta-glucuronidase